MTTCATMVACTFARSDPMSVTELTSLKLPVRVKLGINEAALAVPER